MEIGQKLKDNRAKSGLTQEAVAEKIGVSRQTISNWENNRSYPDIASILRLSDLYAVSLDELLKEDANMRKHVEESANLLKTIWNLLYDTSIILLPLATLLRHYGWDTATGIVFSISAALFILPRLLVPKLFGGSWKLEFLRICSYLLLFTDIVLPFPEAPLAGSLGLALIMYVFYEDKKNGQLRKTNWVAFALILAVPLFIFISEAELHDDNNAYSPFPHTYRVAEVLHTEDPEADLPLIHLSSGNSLYLRDPRTWDSHCPGEMTALDVPEGDPSAPKGIWQLIPEDDPSLLYKVTVEADETVTLSCQKQDILQWKYRLSRVDTLKIGFKTSASLLNMGSNGGFSARWFPEGTFHDHDNLEHIDSLAKTDIGLNPEYPVETLTVCEEYYRDGVLEADTLTLIRSGNGAFRLSPEARYDSGVQYIIYRIPFDGGEYVFRVDFN